MYWVVWVVLIIFIFIALAMIFRGDDRDIYIASIILIAVILCLFIEICTVTHTIVTTEEMTVIDAMLYEPRISNIGDVMYILDDNDTVVVSKIDVRLIGLHASYIYKITDIIRDSDTGD
jgi:hypothetical protein